MTIKMTIYNKDRSLTKTELTLKEAKNYMTAKQLDKLLTIGVLSTSKFNARI